MGRIIGIDEAGYGPNLGPLVITATAWDVPGDPRRFDFWSSIADVVCQEKPGPSHLHVADSKNVYSPAKGIASLERSLLSLLSATIGMPESFARFASQLSDLWNGAEPWYFDRDLSYPVAVDEDEISAFVSRLEDSFHKAGIKCIAVKSEIVPPVRFNQLVELYGNKSRLLSNLSLGLLSSVWDLDSDEPTLVVCDKHGGRNRYDELLDDHADGRMIFRVEEGRFRSVYRIGPTEIRFQMKAEEHFPVAVSSMVCKYVRETAMELFNSWWQKRVDGLKPTKGYPQDARRFREDIAAAVEELQIDESILWRCR